MNTTPLPDIDIATLRAWAEAGVISTARYVEEVERRRREQALAAQAVAFEALDCVFSPDEVVALVEWQMPKIDHADPFKFRGHPFTCPNRGDVNHRNVFGDLGALVPTVRGWICPFCDYSQGWAHGFMKGQRELTKVDLGEDIPEAKGDLFQHPIE